MHKYVDSINCHDIRSVIRERRRICQRKITLACKVMLITPRDSCPRQKCTCRTYMSQGYLHNTQFCLLGTFIIYLNNLHHKSTTNSLVNIFKNNLPLLPKSGNITCFGHILIFTINFKPPPSPPPQSPLAGNVMFAPVATKTNGLQFASFFIMHLRLLTQGTL